MSAIAHRELAVLDRPLRRPFGGKWSNPTQLTYNRQSDKTPSFSPGDKKIVFLRAGPNPKGYAQYALYTIRPDGSGVRHLTNFSDYTHGYCEQPDWQPLPP